LIDVTAWWNQEINPHPRYFLHLLQSVKSSNDPIGFPMLDEGPTGFEGGMSAKKYMTITGASKATATRDLQDLANKGIVVPAGGGRSIHYKINL
jgi:Fic family protein